MATQLDPRRRRLRTLLGTEIPAAPSAAPSPEEPAAAPAPAPSVAPDPRRGRLRALLETSLSPAARMERLAAEIEAAVPSPAPADATAAVPRAAAPAPTLPGAPLVAPPAATPGTGAAERPLPPLEVPDVLRPPAPRLPGQPEPAAPVREFAPPPVPSLGARFQNAAARFMQGTLGVPASALEGVAVLAKALDEQLGGLEHADKEARDLATYRAGQAIREFAERTFPSDPALQGRFISDVVPQAFGSLAAFLAGGLGARALGGSSAALAGGAGVTGAAAEGYGAARAAGAPEETALAAGVTAAPVGALEAVPIERALGRAARVLSGGAAPRVVSALSGAAEEAIQEGLAQTGQNIVAREFFDPTRGTFEGVPTAAGAGALAGAGASVALEAGAEAAARRRERAAAGEGAPGPLARILQGETVGRLRRGVAARISPELEREATRDPLTGLLNKRADAETTEGALAERQPGARVVRFRIDLDNFKALNDQRGHAAGDEALRTVAGALEAATRAADVVSIGRPGGDEFAVTLRVAEGADPAGIRDRLEQAAEAALERAGLRQAGDRLVGVSIGFAEASEGMSAAALEEAADQAAIARKAERGISRPREAAAEGAAPAPAEGGEAAVQPAPGPLSRALGQEAEQAAQTGLQQPTPAGEGGAAGAAGEAQGGAQVGLSLEQAERLGRINRNRMLRGEPPLLTRDEIREALAQEPARRTVELEGLSDDELRAKYGQYLRGLVRAQVDLARAAPGGRERVAENTWGERLVVGGVGGRIADFARGRQTQAEARLRAAEAELRRRGLDVPALGEAYQTARPSDLMPDNRAWLAEVRAIEDPAELRRMQEEVEEQLLTDQANIALVERWNVLEGEIARRGGAGLALAAAVPGGEPGADLPFTPRRPLAQAMQDAMRGLIGPLELAAEIRRARAGRAGGPPARPGRRPAAPRGAGGERVGFPAEMQDDLFGEGRQVAGGAQREMFEGAEGPQGLAAAERQARATVERLRPLVERDAATPEQREQYREALALLRRGEAMSEEEVRLRAAPEAREGQEEAAPPRRRRRPRSEPPASPEAQEIADESGEMFPDDLPQRAYTRRPADPLEPENARPIAPQLAGALAVSEEGTRGRRVSAPEVMRAFAEVARIAGRRVAFRVGRLGTRRAAGWFNVRTEVVRIGQANNIPTAAHELAHALEKIVYGWPKESPWRAPLLSGKLQGELTRLGRALYGETRPAAGYKREGFAEFLRIWLTESTLSGEPTTPEKEAPLFTRWFEGVFLNERPDVRRALERARDLVRRWRAQGSLERARAGVVDPAAPGARLRAAARGVRRFFSMEQLVEMAQPLHDLAREAEARLGRKLEPEEDPFFTLSALRTTHAARTRYMVERAMIDLAGNPVGGSLQEAAELVKGRYEDFVVYLWAQRTLALQTDPAGPRESGLSAQDALQILRELETPEFMLAASKVYEWNEGVLNYAAQASPTFRQAVEAVRERDPGNYVPLQREFEELDRRWKGAGGGGRRSPVKRLKGSGRRIKDPFQSMIAQAERTVRAAHERLVLDQIVRLASVEGMGHFIEEVAVDQRPVATRTLEQLVEEINRRLAVEGQPPLKVGREGDAVDPDLLAQTVTFFAPVQQTPAGEPIFAVYDEGRLRWFHLDEDLFRTLSALDVYRLPKLLDFILAGPARLVRAGTTGLRASFALFWNPMRDVQSLYTNTRSSAAAPRLVAEWMRALGEMALSRTAARHSAWVDAWIRLGGEMAQPLGQDIPHTRRAARRLFQGRRVRLLDPRNWFDFYRDLIQFPEGAPRVAELRLAAEEVGWEPGQPMTLAQSLQLLLASKQPTTDFTAAGEFARAMNQIVPFHNAAIQGPRAAIRAARRNPQRFAWRGLQLTLVTLLLWWRVKDEDWYKEMDPRERFLHWHVPFTNPATGAEELARIPRAFEIGTFFSALPEALFDAAYRQDPESVGEWFETLAELAPPVLPAVLEEPAEQLANRDFFFDRPIVPRSEERRPPAEQFNEYTSRAAIILGDLFDVSPRRIDHAITGIFGPVGGDVLAVLGLGPAGREREKELADLPIIGRGFVRGGQEPSRPRSVDELYERAAEAQRRQHSDRKPETERERQQRLQLEDATRAVSALLFVRRHAHGREQRETLTRAARTIAQEALEAHGRGVLDRPRFAQERRGAERLREDVRQALEQLETPRRRRLPGAKREAVAAPGRRQQ